MVLRNCPHSTLDHVSYPLCYVEYNRCLYSAKEAFVQMAHIRTDIVLLLIDSQVLSTFWSCCSLCEHACYLLLTSLLTPALCRSVTADCDAGQLWPQLSTAATGIVKEQLDPQLAQNKPKWISDIYLHRFNLGDEPPSISGVKVKCLILCGFSCSRSLKTPGQAYEHRCPVCFLLCVSFDALCASRAEVMLVKVLCTCCGAALHAVVMRDATFLTTCQTRPCYQALPNSYTRHFSQHCQHVGLKSPKTTTPVSSAPLHIVQVKSNSCWQSTGVHSVAQDLSWCAAGVQSRRCERGGHH